MAKAKKYPIYHRNTMLVGFALVILLMSIGAVIASCSEKTWYPAVSDYLETSPVILMILLVSWFVFRLFFAKPKCPECKFGKPEYIGKHEEYDQLVGVEIHKRVLSHPSRSRHFKCQQCGAVFLVPLISQEN